MEYRQTAQERTVCDGYLPYIHFHKQLNYTPTGPFFQPCFLSTFSYTFCAGFACNLIDTMLYWCYTHDMKTAFLMGASLATDGL